MITLIITLTIISISSTTILVYKLYENVYSLKIDILQTLDGKYIPTVNGKFICIFVGEARFRKRPEIFSVKSDAEKYLHKWLSIKGLGLKSVGLDKDIEL